MLRSSFLTLVALTALVARSTPAFEGSLLTGNVIGTATSVDYSNGLPSTTVNTVAHAFDGNLETCFASYDRSFTWAGLDLGKKYVITGVGYAARHDGLGPDRMRLGVFQGANNEDFSDAVPLYLISESAPYGEMTYAPVQNSRGFRYVRYVGPHDARCNVAELEFYGCEGDGDDSNLYRPTNLPLVVVNTPGMEWFNGDKEYAMENSTITVVDAEGGVSVSATGQIRGRGNASWGFPKKPFRIKFDKKQNVLDAPAKAKKWTMINNYGDKTLMRNMLAFEVSRRIGMEYTPYSQPVDLIFNGEYQGTYLLCDQVEVNKNRVNITEMETSDTEGEALTGGYLVEIDAYADQEAPDEWFYSSYNYIPVTIKSPDAGVSQQYNYIRTAFSNMEQAVFSSDFTNPQTGYRAHLDLESFLRHFIVGEVSGNTDTYWSVYMTLDRGQSRFRTGPCWDFDLAFDNDQRTYPVNNKNNFVCFSGGSFADGMWNFVDRIINRDTEARNQLIEIWADARENRGLNADDFTALVDEYASLLDKSQRLNFMRWNILNECVHQNPAARGSYEAEVGVVRNYLKNRFARIDSYLGYEWPGVTPAPEPEPDPTPDPNPEEGAIVTITIPGTPQPVIYYNLQGIPVANPTSGTFIRVCGSERTKVRF